MLTPGNVRVEVKSSAYLQAWETPPDRTPQITYSGLKGRRLAPDGAPYLDGPQEFRADAYVFALHAARDCEQYDVFDTGKWRFWVVSRTVLANLNQYSIRLSRLRSMNEDVVEVVYEGLADAIAEAGEREFTLSFRDETAPERN